MIEEHATLGGLAMPMPYPKPGKILILRLAGRKLSYLTTAGVQLPDGKAGPIKSLPSPL
jgi:hypothetical protein